MNYDKMSDGELSLEVGKRVVDGICSYMIDGDKAIFNTRCDDEFVMFCINDWADIGPIIESHNISLQAGRVSDDYWFASDAKEDFFGVDKNPKRATAICFLKMMEQVKNDDN